MPTRMWTSSMTGMPTSTRRLRGLLAATLRRSRPTWSGGQLCPSIELASVRREVGCGITLPAALLNSKQNAGGRVLMPQNKALDGIEKSKV